MNNELSIIKDVLPMLDDNKSDHLARIGGLLLGNVPVVGSILTEVFKTVIPNQKEERVRIFVEVLAEKLKYIDDDVLNLKMRSEEFTDLLEDAIPQAARAMNKDRQSYIASALKNSLTDEQLEHIEKKKLLQLLNEVNDAEVLFLHFLSLKFSQIDQSERIGFAKKHTYLFDEYDDKEKKKTDIFLNNKSALRKSYMAKLEEIGLAQIITEGTSVYTPWITRSYSNKDKIESVTSGNLRITPLGSLFLYNIDVIEKEDITKY
jgi:hypothetical protein